ncbi:hypothetical protein SIL81_07975 [Xanthomonas campestris pv. incanae]|uniref:hypothetical protein n=1 Tax=Xanthomonas campestris TaxID=339 RepID=UPI0029C5495C|nr:hypothetical protein [Xanthomonas campestris]MDX6081211.1 hypothetical protein [Xanthomonas campestris pv. incanae]MDX6087688.1 hypothetical protein [Xanthomonas campestris pv. incanae]MDX6139133.1 hypothetical protein [Xanthomonas campestris pv. incanae]
MGWLSFRKPKQDVALEKQKQLLALMAYAKEKGDLRLEAYGVSILVMEEMIKARDALERATSMILDERVSDIQHDLVDHVAVRVASEFDDFVDNNASHEALEMIESALNQAQKLAEALTGRPMDTAR